MPAHIVDAWNAHQLVDVAFELVKTSDHLRQLLQVGNAAVLGLQKG